MQLYSHPKSDLSIKKDFFKKWGRGSWAQLLHRKFLGLRDPKQKIPDYFAM